MNSDFRFVWKPNDAEQILDNWKGSSLRVAVAYFYDDGLDLLQRIHRKNGWLGNENIQVFLAPRFNAHNPADMIKRLSEIAQVYIVAEPLHAKVLALEGYDGQVNVFFGSANLTAKGLGTNLEFGATVTVDGDLRFEIDEFFNHCRSRASEPTDAILDKYGQIAEIEAAQDSSDPVFREIETLLLDRCHDGLPPVPPDFYFSREDYGLLKRRGYGSPDGLRTIEKKIAKLEQLLRMHFRTNPYVVSQHSMVKEDRDWACLRVGRPRNKTAMPDEPVWKQSSFQLIVTPTQVLLGIWHSKHYEPSPSDRSYLNDQISKPDFTNKMSTILGDLQKTGARYEWLGWINDYDPAPISLPLRQKDLPDFIPWVRKALNEHREIMFIERLKPDDPRLKNEGSITQAFIQMVEELTPLYRLIAFHNDY